MDIAGGSPWIGSSARNAWSKRRQNMSQKSDEAMHFDERARQLLRDATYEDVWCLLVACKLREAALAVGEKR